MTFTVSGLSGYPTVVLQPGNTVYSANVYALQEWLVKNGFLTQAEVNTGPGIYGPQTTAAVEALQEALVGTGYLTQAEVNSGPGYYGPLTIAAVGAELAALTTTPAAPTATAHNQSGVAPGTSIPLSTLFTYSVASGDTVLGFDFKETTNNGGYVTDNNGNRLTPGIVYGNAGTGIPISELSQYHYVAGPAGTSDIVAFNVEDQYDQISAAVSATVSVALPAAPTATAHNQGGVAPGTSIPLSTLFTYSAAAGDTVLGFDFKETTNDGGYITDNNGNRLTPGIVYGNAGTGIPISELSQYHYVAGPAGTSDTVAFNVEDQYDQISAAVSATVNVALPAAPTATAHNQGGVAPGTSIPLSTLFTYSATAGDTVLGFDFKETTNDGGYVTDNLGNKLTPGIVYGNAGTGIPISELSQYHYVAGPGGTSDTVAFNVEDQYDQISAVVSATISTATPAVAPTLSSVSPPSYLANNGSETMELIGSHFVSGATLTFVDPQGQIFANEATTYVSSSELLTTFSNGDDPGTWKVEVNSSNGNSSYVSFTVASYGSVDTYHQYSDTTPGHPTAADIVSAAENYIGTEWGAYNCTGLVWAVSDAVGADYYETANQVASSAAESVPQVRTTVPDPGDPPTASATPVGFPGYVLPSGAGIYGDWTTFISTTSGGDRGWTADVQIGDLVRIPANVLPDGEVHSFIVVGGNQQDGWEVIDNTNPSGGENPVTISEHTFNYPNNVFYKEVLQASKAYISYLTPADVLGETVPGPLTVVTGTGTAVTGVSVVDAGAGSDTFTTKITAKGTLAATGAGVSGSGTSSLTITGALSQVNTDLATLSYKNASAGSDTITVTTSDSHASPTSVTKTIGVTINPADALSENVPAPLTATAGVSKAISGVLVVDAGAGNDTFTTKVTAKGTLTATGTGVSGSGTTSLTVTGSLSQVNADLATLSYKNASTGSDTVTVTTTDAHANPTSVTKTIAVTINPADALSESAPTSLTATAGAGTAVTGVSIVDAGAGSDTFTTKITAKGTLTATGTGVSGSGTSSLTVTGSLSQVNTDLATLSYKNASAGSDTITVTTSDSHASPTSVAKTIGVTINSATTASVTLNDATMSNDGALQIVNTFNGNGGTVTYYGPVLFDGFTITNLDRTDFALTSFNAGFASTNGYFFDGADVLDVPAGGSVPTVDTIQIQQQNGDPFSVQSIDLDTIFAATGQSATFKGVTANNSIVTETFDLDNVQGMQTFKFASTFTDLKYLDFAPSMNEFFDNIVLTPTSTPGELSQDAAYSSTTIEAGETLEIKNAYSGGVDFTASTGTLQLDSSSSFSGTVAGMSGQDTIDFRDIKFANQKPAYMGTAAGGALSLTDGTHSANIALLGNYLASTFVASSDGHGGTNVVDPLLVASNQQTLLTQPQHA